MAFHLVFFAGNISFLNGNRWKLWRQRVRWMEKEGLIQILRKFYGFWNCLFNNASKGKILPILKKKLWNVSIYLIYFAVTLPISLLWRHFKMLMMQFQSILNLKKINFINIDSSFWENNQAEVNMSLKINMLYKKLDK